MAKSTVAVRFTGDTKKLSASLREAEGKLKGFGAKAAGALKVGLAAAGAIGAAALVKGFSDGLAKGKIGDKIAAQFGLSADESERQGKIAGDLYVNAYGESLGEVSTAVADVVSLLGDGLDDDAISDLTANALDFASAFDRDVTEAIGAAQRLLENDLVDSGEEAFDLLTAAMQDTPRVLQDEVFASIEEYSQFLAQLGIDGAEAFELIGDAAVTDGKYGIDKVGDSLKELTIRATDGSTATVDAYETMGLAADDMAGRFLAGGEVGRAALDDLVDGLLAIEDPTEQAQAAIALFGTPLEDLGTGEIPEFLAQLDSMGGGFDDVAGAADRMGDTLNDNAATKIEAFKRKAFDKLATVMAEKVIPAIEEFAPKAIAVFEDVRDTVGPVVRDIWEGIQSFIEDLQELWDRHGETIMAVVERAWQFVSETIAGVLRIIKGVWETFMGVFTGDWDRMWNGIKDVFGGVWDVIEARIALVVDIIQGLWSTIVDEAKKVPGRLLQAGKDMIQKLIDGILSKLQAVKDAVSRVVNALNPLSGGDATGLQQIGAQLGGQYRDPGNNSRTAGPSAGGGLMSAGRTYLVGEQGPELIRPSGNGNRVMPLETAAADRGGSLSRTDLDYLADRIADSLASMPAPVVDVDRLSIALRRREVSLL